MLQQMGIRLQKFELDKILETHDRNKDKKLSKEEFEDVKPIIGPTLSTSSLFSST